ncbi:MAG: hypothetical protein C9356_02580 [Oleiphilus sp.]|nr:MAG: hypothetical protein C9356_02580 [Oleiphilus sp.]
MVAELKVVESKGDFQLDGDELPLLPPGEYEVGFDCYETRFLHRGHKLVLWFKVATMGEHFGKRLPRYYNISRMLGKAGKNGKFRAGRKSDFVREFYSVIPKQIGRLDRIPMTALNNVLVRAKVKTVTNGYDQRPIPEPLQYSVIEELVGAVK